MIKQLHRVEFLYAMHNVELVGGPGTGKTHLATAIGTHAMGSSPHCALDVAKSTRHSGNPMKFTQDSGPAGYMIRAYAPGRVTVAYPPADDVAAIAIARHERLIMREEQLNASFIIAPQHLLRDWAPQCFTDLREEHLQQLAALDPEVVLLGTGEKIRFPPGAWLAAFHQRGIGVEVMDLGATCRTYNILMAEGRSVAAAIMTR